MSKFNVDFRVLAALVVPYFKRTDKNLDWLESLLKGIKTVHTQFLAFRDQNLIDVQFTGQIIYMEKLLNDIFDPSARTIYIDNVAQVDREFIHLKSEPNAPVFYLFRKGEPAQTRYLKNKQDYNLAFDFIVMVNTSVTFDEPLMRSIVEKYKLAGKRYTIQTYT